VWGRTEAAAVAKWNADHEARRAERLAERRASVDLGRVEEKLQSLSAGHEEHLRPEEADALLGRLHAGCARTGACPKWLPPEEPDDEADDE
jgi:hypothetical protein